MFPHEMGSNSPVYGWKVAFFLRTWRDGGTRFVSSGVSSQTGSSSGSTRFLGRIAAFIRHLTFCGILQR